VVKPSLDRCFAGEEVSFAEWFDNPGGRKYWVVTYSPLRLDSEQVDSALAVARDLTEQTLAAETCATPTPSSPTSAASRPSAS
jgi:hypothetical protein